MFIETSDPAFVQDQATQQIVPRDSVDPADIMAPAAPAPAPLAPEAAPAPVAAPAASASPVDAALSKLDNPELAPYRAPAGMQRQGVTVQRGQDTAPFISDTIERTNRATSNIMGRAETKQKDLEGINARETEMTAQRRDEAKAQVQLRALERENARKAELALRDQTDPAIDPNQFMRENGLAMVLLAALSGAFGAIAQDGGRGGEQFIGIVERRIDRNIAAQKSQIESGRLRRGNLIDYYMKEGLDAKEAEAAAKGVYYAQAARFVDLEKERAGLGDITAQAQQASDALNAQAAAQIQNLTLAGQDRVSESFAKPAPKAKGMTESEYLDLEEKRAKKDDRKTKQGNADTVADIVGHPVTPEEASKIEQDTQELAKQNAVNKNTKATILRVAKLHGLTVGPDGRVSGEPNVGVRPLGASVTERSKREDSAWAALKRADVMGMAREPSAKLQDEFGGDVERPFYDSEIAGKLNQMLDAVDDKEDALKSGYGDAGKLYDARTNKRPDDASRADDGFKKAGK